MATFLGKQFKYMLKIERILDTPFTGLEASVEALNMFRAMRTAFETTFEMSFTSRTYESEDKILQSKYFNSDKVSLALTSILNYEVYILEINLEEEELEEISNEFIEKYAHVYSLEELIENACKELKQGADRAISILIAGSYNGSQGVDKRIVEVLHQALTHPDPDIRANACWIAYANETYCIGK